MSDFKSKLDDGELAPFLKKEAIVSVKMSTGFLQQVSAINLVLVEGKSQEDIQNIETLIKEKKELEPWMTAIVTIQTLIRAAFQEGEKTGMVEFKTLEDGLKEAIGDDLLTEETQPSDL